MQIGKTSLIGGKAFKEAIIDIDARIFGKLIQGIGKGCSEIKTLSSVTVVYYDFSLAASQYYGQGGKMIVSGVWALPSGDINNDAAISSRDYVAWYQRQFLSPPPGYYDEDINGDGAVNNNDFLLWQTNARAGWRSTLP